MKSIAELKNIDTIMDKVTSFISPVTKTAILVHSTINNRELRVLNTDKKIYAEQE